MKFNYKKILKEEYQEWLENSFNKELLYLAPVADLQKYIREKKTASIAIEFDHLQPWYAKDGVAQIAREETFGWENVHRAIFLREWSQRIWVKMVELDGDPEVSVRGVIISDFELAFLNALWSGNAEMTAWLGSHFCHWITDERYLGGSRYNNTGVAGLAFNLYHAWKNRQPVPPPKNSPPLGVYQAIFDHWTDEANLTKAILMLCDYHVERTTEHFHYDIAEFMSAPYDLIPVEYLALKQVRRQQGLSTPKPNHPLLNTPLAEPPEPLPPFHDELLYQALAAVREAIPDL